MKQIETTPVLLLLALSPTAPLGRDCGIPGIPSGGRLNPLKPSYTDGEQVSYSCSQDLQVVGSRSIRCQGGRWRGSRPHCLSDLAAGRPAERSRELWSYAPSLANDASTSSCSYTTAEEGGKQAWWKVTLERATPVGRVEVTPAPGTRHFVVLVLLRANLGRLGLREDRQHECEIVKAGRSDGQPVIIDCGGFIGTEVMVRDRREGGEEYFGLCQVEVFAKPGRDACGRPEVPLLATVEVDGTIATYSCTEEGLVMEGSARLTCQGGEWQGDPPTCRERVCPSPRPASGGYIEVPEFRGSYTRGLTAIYRLVVKSCPILITNPRCSPGLVLRGSASRTCLSSGRPSSCISPSCLLSC